MNWIVISVPRMNSNVMRLNVFRRDGDVIIKSTAETVKMKRIASMSPTPFRMERTTIRLVRKPNSNVRTSNASIGIVFAMANTMDAPMSRMKVAIVIYLAEIRRVNKDAFDHQMVQCAHALMAIR